jgi:hypothetical protein
VSSKREGSRVREDKKKEWRSVLLLRHLILAVGVLFLVLTDMSCGSTEETSSGSVPAPVVVSSSGGMLISASAINFARNAVVGDPPGDPLISREQANAALAQASRMLSELEAKNPAIVGENPIAAYVIEHPDDHFIAKPVVLGISDRSFYEVLAGLSPGEIIVVGVQSG